MPGDGAHEEDGPLAETGRRAQRGVLIDRGVLGVRRAGRVDVGTDQGSKPQAPGRDPHPRGPPLHRGPRHEIHHLVGLLVGSRDLIESTDDVDAENALTVFGRVVVQQDDSVPAVTSAVDCLGQPDTLGVPGAAQEERGHDRYRADAVSTARAAGRIRRAAPTIQSLQS